MIIGVYDSGLGGLSMLRAIQAQLPNYGLVYLADTAFCPYGPRPVGELRQRALACANWLIAQDVGVVVVACNTASSATLELLRAELPVPVVGMEPGVKPAVAATRTRRIGVLATDGTLTGARFSSLVKRFAGDVVVHTISCPRLVTQVEAGDLDGPATRNVLRDYLAPLQEQGVDTIVLGCTHFPFLSPLINEMVGPGVTVIDTSPAVAQQVARVVTALEAERKVAALRFATTGVPEQVAPVLARLWGSAYPIEQAIC